MVNFSLLTRDGKPATSKDKVSVLVNGTEASLDEIGEGAYSVYHQVTDPQNTLEVLISGKPAPGFPIKFARPEIEPQIEALQAQRVKRQQQIEKDELEKLVNDKVEQKKAAKAKAEQEAKAKAEQETKAKPSPKPVSVSVAASEDDASTKPASSLRNMFETKPVLDVKPAPLNRPSAGRGTVNASFLNETKESPQPSTQAARPSAGRGKLASMWEQKLQEQKK